MSNLRRHHLLCLPIGSSYDRLEKVTLDHTKLEAQVDVLTSKRPDFFAHALFSGQSPGLIERRTKVDDAVSDLRLSYLAYRTAGDWWSGCKVHFDKSLSHLFD